MIQTDAVAVGPSHLDECAVCHVSRLFHRIFGAIRLEPPYHVFTVAEIPGKTYRMIGTQNGLFMVEVEHTPQFCWSFVPPPPEIIAAMPQGTEVIA